uniref:Uncharacterized protein n=1 Tax=Tetranychus urticae TaxID=32264 RepID=T1KV24_TETUR
MDSEGHAIGSDTLQQKLLEPKLEGHPDHSPLQQHNQLDQSPPIQPSPYQPQPYLPPTHRPPPQPPTQTQLPPDHTSRGQAWQRTNNNMNITNYIYILDGRSPVAMDIINRCLQGHSRWNRPY